MKKVLYGILMFILAAFLGVIPVHAEDRNVTLEVTPSSTEPHPGGEVTFTFTLKSNNLPVTGVTFVYEIPEGMTQTSYTTFSKELFTLYPPMLVGNRLTCIEVMHPVTAGSIPLLAVTCKVDENAALGARSVTVSSLEVTDADRTGAKRYNASSSVTAVNVSHSASQHKWVDDGVVTPATCVKDGVMNQKCSVDNCDATQTRAIKAAGHHTNLKAQFDWKGTSAQTPGTVTAVVTCEGENCEYKDGKTITVPAENIEKIEVGSSCTGKGNVSYAATLDIDGEVLRGVSSSFEVAVLGHRWSEPTYSWNGAEVTATRYCTRDWDTETKEQVKVTGIEKKTEATCTEDGESYYTASGTFPDDNTPFQAESIHVVAPATGHQWGDAVFVWNDDGSVKSVTAACGNAGCPDGGTVDLTGSVKVTSQITKEATCTEPGLTKYTATVTGPKGGTYPQKVYQDVKEVEISAKGHNWGNPVFLWQKDSGTEKWTVTGAMRICLNDAQHRETHSASVAENVTAPSYTAKGKVVYTATAEFDGKTYTDTKEEEIPMLEASVLASVPVENAGSGAQTALQNSADKLVSDVIKGSSQPAGMPKEVYEAIKEAEENSQEGLSVTTTLNVEEEQTPSEVQGALSAIDATITITVKKANGSTVSGNITEVPEPICLRFPKPAEGGPIFYVVTDHNGGWEKLACGIEGDYIVFYTSQFSNFVLVGSSDISDAEIGIDPSSYEYTGSAITPKVTVTINGGANILTEGKDYTLTYENNTEPGTAVVKIQGIGNYTGTAQASFTINSKPAPLPSQGSAPEPSPSVSPDVVLLTVNAPSISPKTGDETPLILYVSLFVVFAAVLVYALALRRRNQK